MRNTLLLVGLLALTPALGASTAHAQWGSWSSASWSFTPSFDLGDTMLIVLGTGLSIAAVGAIITIIAVASHHDARAQRPSVSLFDRDGPALDIDPLPGGALARLTLSF